MILLYIFEIWSNRQKVCNIKMGLEKEKINIQKSLRSNTLGYFVFYLEVSVALVDLGIIE